MVSERQQGAVTADRSSYPALIVAAASFLAYVGTTGFQFVYDDLGQIVENPSIRSWRFLPQYFSSHVWAGLAPTSNYYRPLDLVWFRINYALFGLHPWGWHFAGILAHIGATLIVLRLVYRLFADRFLALLSALIFGLHPIHVQSVAWVSGASDPLLTIFMVGSFLAYLNFREKKSSAWLIWSLVLYAGASLLKEPGVMLPALIFAYELIQPENEAPHRRNRLRIAISAVLPFVAVFAGYFAARIHALHSFAPSLSSISDSEMVLTWPALLLLYAKHLFLPLGYSLYYDVPLVSTLFSGAFLVPAILLVLLTFLLYAAFRWLRLSPYVTFTAAIWFLIPLLPALYLRAIDPAILGQDRYLYLSCLGFAIFCAAIISALAKKMESSADARPVQAYAAVLLAVILGNCTLVQQQYWANNIALFRRAWSIAPNNDQVLNNLAFALAQRDQFAPAAEIFQRALQRTPNSARLNYNYGFMLYRRGDYGRALSLLSHAAQIDPAMGEAFLYVGMAHLKLGDPQDAATEIRRAIALEPERKGVHVAMGAVLQVEGDVAGALAETRMEAKIYPDDQLVRERLSTLERYSAAKDSHNRQ